MPVVILLVAAVILGGIVVVAMGRGGELARDNLEMPAGADLRTWSEVAKYRPPPALLGYHAASTEQALMIIARSIAERDAEIGWLRGRLAELQPESSGRAEDFTDAAAGGGVARDGQGWADPADHDRYVAEDDRAWPADDQSVAGDDRAGSADDGSAAGDDPAWPGDDQSAGGDDRAWPADDQSVAGDDRAWPADDRSVAGDDRAWPAADQSVAGDEPARRGDDQASTAPAAETTDPGIAPSLQGTAVRAGLATPDAVSMDPSGGQGASAQEDFPASETGPEADGSQSAVPAEAPVQAGHWPQAGTGGES